MMKQIDMTVKELVIHFAPDFRYKLKEYSNGEVIETGMIGDIQDSSDLFWKFQKVKDFTMRHNYLEILV